MAPPQQPWTPTALWLWSSPDAAAALATRDLGTVLRTYRRLNRLSQEKLAALLGYDKTYICLIETGRRQINDLAGRRHITRVLGLPPHVLGVTTDDDADFTAMVQFAESTIRLAETVRRAGHALDAVHELWPLAARLDARVAEGHVERDTLVLLASARVALGVSLGTVLPEERLATAARWTGKAVAVAAHLADPPLLAHVLRMHGNELRKAGRTAAAVTRLHHAAALSTEPEDQATAFALLARAAAEHGDAALFDHAITRHRDLLDAHNLSGMLANPFTLREIHLRGLVATGRATQAAHAIDHDTTDSAPVAPQWHVIERVTASEVHLAANNPAQAEDALRTAVHTAETHRLPHQLQRAIRAARAGGLPTLAAEGIAALRRLTDHLAATTPVS